MDSTGNHSQPPDFADFVSIPPFLCPTAFNCLTNLNHFRSWANGVSDWQLRVVGSPGTGKTTLSALLVQDLRRIHGSSAVAAVFMKAQTTCGPEELVANVLWSVFFQLTGKRYDLELKHQTSNETTRALRDTICESLHANPHVFLVVDDLDSVGYRSVRAIEEELDILQKHGLRTMITSRVARYPTIHWSCDASEGHSIEFDCDVWVCSECCGQAESLGEEEKEDVLSELFVTCTSCMEQRETERICSEDHEPSTKLRRPYNYAQIHLDEIMSKKWETEPSDFALWTVQHEHGLISPGMSKNLWPDNEWPPLTPVGRLLKGDRKIISDIMRHSAGNLTLAKLRLEEVCEADVLDKFRLVQDRLPQKVVSLFGSQITSVAGQTRSVAMLGLIAIKLATTQQVGVSIDRIQMKLRSLKEEEDLSSLDAQEVLHASKGLLKESANGQHIEAYHADFLLYATERYNEDLEQQTI